MTQQEKEKVSFFSKTPKQQVNKGISIDFEAIGRGTYKAFKKMGYYAILGSVIWWSANGIYQWREEGKREDAIKEAKEVAELNMNISNSLKQINSISEQEFEQYLTYMKDQATLYDKKVDLVSNAIIQAEHEWAVRKQDEKEVLNLNSANNLNSELTAYKARVEARITSDIQLFKHINTFKNTDFSLNDATNFLERFNQYKMNLVGHNVDLEKTINNYLFIDYKGNKSYNQEQKIYEQAKAIDLEMENRFKNTNTSVKPK